jgi:hypothetical protein
MKNNNDLCIQGTTNKMSTIVDEYQLVAEFKNIPKEKHELFLQIFHKL